MRIKKTLITLVCLAIVAGAGYGLYRLFTFKPDFQMPQMTGVQLSREILKIRPDIPIILCTGFSESIDAAKVESTGIGYFLMKPITLLDLSRAAHSALFTKATES